MKHLKIIPPLAALVLLSGCSSGFLNSVKDFFSGNQNVKQGMQTPTPAVSIPVTTSTPYRYPWTTVANYVAPLTQPPVDFIWVVNLSSGDEASLEAPISSFITQLVTSGIDFRISLLDAAPTAAGNTSPVFITSKDASPASEVISVLRTITTQQASESNFDPLTTLQNSVTATTFTSFFRYGSEHLYLFLDSNPLPASVTTLTIATDTQLVQLDQQASPGTWILDTLNTNTSACAQPFFSYMSAGNSFCGVSQFANAAADLLTKAQNPPVQISLRPLIPLGDEVQIQSCTITIGSAIWGMPTQIDQNRFLFQFETSYPTPGTTLNVNVVYTELVGGK